MLLRIWFFLLLFLASENVVAAMASQSSPLRCLTFNTLHGGVFSGLTGDAQDLDRRLDIILEELQVLDPDVLGLQEASTGRSRGNVAARIAAQLGFHYVYAPASFRLFASEWINAITNWVMNFTEGPAIISRFPIVSSQAYDLPRCGRFTDPRVLLCAELETPWGLLPVCSTHISGSRCHTDDILRVIQSRRGALPVLLMGDFNASEDSPAITTLTREAGFIDAFRAANPMIAGTTVWQWVYAPHPTVWRRVDYLFLSPGQKLSATVLSSRVVLNTPRQLPDGRMLWPSDHYGVLTEVQFGASS